MQHALAVAINRARHCSQPAPPIQPGLVLREVKPLPPSILAERDLIIHQLGELNSRLIEIDEEIVKCGTQITIGAVQRAVVTHYDITMTELISQRRDLPLTRKRHIAMYLAKKLTSKSLVLIGKMFGDRDHTTVLHAVRKIEKQVEANPTFANEMAELTAIISAA